MTNALVEAGKAVVLLGPLIHNKEVMQDFEQRGVRVISSVEEVRPGETLVIRAHGVPLDVMNSIELNSIPYTDATCPFVKKIHRIVAERTNAAGTAPAALLLICGDRAHPEVIGIKSYSAAETEVVYDSDELSQLLKSRPDLCDIPSLCIAQTTFDLREWKRIKEISQTLLQNCVIFDTICYATESRQISAQEISRQSEAMVVIGDRFSSNTAKLTAVCEKNCKTVLVETAKDLVGLEEELKRYSTIGVTAGASTPTHTIKEVLRTMADITGQEPEIVAAGDTAAEEIAVAPVQEQALSPEEDFAKALEESLGNMSSDQRVKGIVTAVSPSEIQVDIGRKQTGYVAADEFSADPSVNMAETVKVGDTFDLIIMKTNDQEGTVQLSKKRADSQKSWGDIVESEAAGTILEGKVTDIVNGGIRVFVSGMRVFVPASLTGVPRDKPLDDLKGTTVQLRIVETNAQKRRAVGSIRAASQTLRKQAEDKFWSNAEVGKRIVGTVKSLTSYGAFVDIGGLDGMVHISELSWSRVKHPSDVLTVGQEVEVYIKSLDPEKRKISLGYRKAEDNPWEQLREKYPVGSIVTCTVVSFTAFGAFARIIPGVDGLIHISQIADRRVDKPQDELKIGQEVNCKIVGIDFEKHRVSLSMRALTEEQDEEPEPLPDEDVVVASSSTPDPEA
jgi:4-hydroxy-3-methylbut-2-enyl diphosphate reductase